MNNDKLIYFNSIEESKNLKSKALKSSAISIITRISSQAIQTLSIFILARIVSPTEFGLVAMATSVIGFILFLNDLGLTDAIIQEKEIDHQQVSTLFWINEIISISITIFLILISPLITLFFKEPQLKPVFIVSSLIFIIAGSSLQHRALLKRNLFFFQLSIIEITSVLLSSLIAIFLALNKWGYWALTVRPIINFLSILILSWFFCKWRPGLPSFKSKISSLIKFGFNSLGTFFLSNIAINLDKTLIGWKFGKETLGFYSRGYYLADIPSNQLSSSLYHVSVSTLSKLREKPEKFRNYYLKAIYIISFLGMPLSFFMSIMSKDIIYILLGPKWEFSSLIFSILSIGTCFQIIHSTNTWLHVSLGRSDRWLKWNILSSSLICISVIFGLLINVIGVAICYISIIFILTFPAIKYAGKPINLKIIDVIKEIWQNFISSLVTGLVCWILFFKFNLASNHILRLILSVLIFLILYLIIIILLNFSFQPIIKIISILKNFLPNKKEKNI